MTQLTNRGPNVVDRVIFVLNFVIEELRTSVYDYSTPWAVKKELRHLCALYSDAKWMLHLLLFME